MEQGGVHYVKRNFFGGRTPASITQTNADALQWCLTTAGERGHGTTKAQPLARFRQTEQERLQPLPRDAYDLAIGKVATVARDCSVVFEQAFYSVPFRLVGQTVQIRGGSREVAIYTHDYARVATHPRAQAAGERLTHPDHLPPHKVAGLQLDSDACQAAASAVGAATRLLVDQLLADAVIDRRRTALRLIRLRETYGDARLEAACQRAIRFDSATYVTVKRILREGLDQDAPEPPPAPAAPPQTFARSVSALFGQWLGGVTWN